MRLAVDFQGQGVTSPTPYQRLRRIPDADVKQFNLCHQQVIVTPRQPPQQTVALTKFCSSLRHF